MNQNDIDILQIIEDNNSGKKQMYATNGFHQTKTAIKINTHSYAQAIVGQIVVIDVDFDARALCSDQDCRCGITDQKIVAYDESGTWYALDSFDSMPSGKPTKYMPYLEYYYTVSEYLHRKLIPLNITTIAHAWRLSKHEIQDGTFTPIQAYDRSVRILSKGKQTVLPDYSGKTENKTK